MLDSALQGLRTFVILAVLAVLVALAGTWGWKAMTAPFPEKVTPPPCVQTTVKKGEKVYPSQVVVSVINASSRSGLAGRALNDFVDAGFVRGNFGDAPKAVKGKVAHAEVWADDPKSPSAQLVASWLGAPKITKGTSDQPGIIVVTGDKFPELKGGKKDVVAAADSKICSPPVE